MEIMNTCTQVPPGFRFHPTDEELVDYYLRRKVNSRRIDLNVIKEVDLYRIEPWDLLEICRMGNEEQSEWYFFSHKDKKYPTGTRTNRATNAGFWKATGRDKAIYSKHELIGMRKTLVFYKGRAPNGHKSDWIMHEYRLETNANGTPQEEGWVVCKVFKKRSPTTSTTTSMRNTTRNDECWYNLHNQVSFMLDLDSPKQTSESIGDHCKKEFDNNLHQLPLLEKSKMLLIPSSECISYGSVGSFQQLLDDSNNMNMNINGEGEGVFDDQVTDWRVLDKFVASQLSQEDASKGNATKDESMLDNS